MAGPGRRGLAGELARIRAASGMIEARITGAPSPRDLDGLGQGELRDLAAVARAAELVVARYDERGRTARLARGLASAMREAADSLGALDDDISESLLSAESSLARIRGLHARMGGPSPINLTSSSTRVDPPEYQPGRRGPANG